MGAAASTIDPMMSISLDKAKELAGDKWNEQLELKFNAIWDEKEIVTLTDVKNLMPALLIEPADKIPVETVKAVTAAAGAEWNEQLQSIFDAHKTTVAVDETTSSDIIEFAHWKALVPILFESRSEREVRLAAEWQPSYVSKKE